MQLHLCSIQKFPGIYGALCCSSTEQTSSLSQEQLCWVEVQRHSPLAVVRSVTAEFGSATLSHCLVPSVPHFPGVSVGLIWVCAAAILCIEIVRENRWLHSFCQHLVQYPSASWQRRGNCPRKFETLGCFTVRAAFLFLTKIDGNTSIQRSFVLEFLFKIDGLFFLYVIALCVIQGLLFNFELWHLLFLFLLLGQKEGRTQYY